MKYFTQTICTILTFFCLLGLTSCKDKEESQQVNSNSTSGIVSTLVETPATEFEYDVQNGGIRIKKFIGSSKDVVIPKEINQLPVTKLEALSFMGTDIEKVVIPDTVTTIRTKAFYLCHNLKSVEFGNCLTEIGNDAFRKCTALEKAILPENLQKLGSYAFAECTVLKEVFIPKALTTWCGYEFFADYALTSLTFEDGIETIGDYGAFQACLSLKEITIPESVTCLGNSTFTRCDNLQKVTFLGDAPAYIGEYVFGTPEEHKITPEVYYDNNTSGWGDTYLKEYNLLVLKQPNAANG